jgi:integrase
MKWPYRIKARKNGPVLAKIYRPCAGRDGYRVAWKAGGKRMMKSLPCFAGLGGAREFAERLAKELASGSQVPALTPAEALDALAVRDALAAFRKETGRVLSPIQAITDYLAAARKLGDRQLSEAVTGFLGTVATVKIVDLAKAVAEFNATREAKTQAKAGERAQLSSHHVYMTALWLGWFAKTFPGTPVCDLRKDHMNAFMQSYSRLAAKSRNHLRGAIRHFFNWCVEQDYLSKDHRLSEASEMKNDTVTPKDTDYYRPTELRKLLDAADEQLRPLIALQGLAGLRPSDARRLTWESVFATPGYIPISATKSKTRRRRVVPICASLAQWLEPYRQHEGPLWSKSADTDETAFTDLRESLGIPSRGKDALRHSYGTYRLAVTQNEAQVAKEMGHKVDILHQHYAGLATPEEAERWFAVAPAPAAANVVPISAAVA